MNIYVGNLAYSVTDEDLKKAFEAYGQVASANVIRDQYSNQSKGSASSKCRKLPRPRPP